MKLCRVLLCCLTILIGGCNAEIATDPTPQPIVLQEVEIKTIVVKLVDQPSDRQRDFTVIRMDGTYTVRFDPSNCTMDVPSYMYGPYDSVQHCGIGEAAIIDGMVNDQVWLNKSLAPFKVYLSCINGWVYQGVDSKGKNIWFVEMFGFPAFCGK